MPSASVAGRSCWATCGGPRKCGPRPGRINRWIIFGDLAEEYSIEPTSKSLRGEVPPIRRYGGQPQLEDVAFELQPGELSGIIQLGDKFVILKCEGRTEPVDVKFQEVRQILHQDIYEKKLRMAMGEKFEEIRTKARIDNFLAGTSQSPDRVKPEAGEVKARARFGRAAHRRHASNAAVARPPMDHRLRLSGVIDE